MSLPNLISILRIAVIPFVVYLLIVTQYFWAAIIFLILALSDWLDGVIARNFDQVTEFGKFIDPLADKLLILSTLITLVILKRADWLPVTLIAVREIVVTGLRFSKKVRQANLLGKIKTVLQTVAVFMLILNVPYAIWILWVAVIVTLYSGIEYSLTPYPPLHFVERGN